MYFVSSQPDILSTPNFVVEVTKQAVKHTLVFDCHYPEDEVSPSKYIQSSYAVNKPGLSTLCKTVNSLTLLCFCFFSRLAMEKVKKRATSLPSVRSASSLREIQTGRRPATHSTQTLWTG